MAVAVVLAAGIVVTGRGVVSHELRCPGGRSDAPRVFSDGGRILSDPPPTATSPAEAIRFFAQATPGFREVPGTSYGRLGPRWRGDGQRYENWAAWAGGDENVGAVFTVSSAPPDGGWQVVQAMGC
jgi:hypothetical protein